MTTHATADHRQSADDPIYALATPALPAAIAIMRITGSQISARLQPLFPKQASWPPKARAMTLAPLVDLDSGKVLDQPLLAYFPAPRSYTGDDTIELHLHGSPYVVRRLMALLEQLGMRQAEPGEFTRRAFLNSKMDLTQAEGIRELIHAQTSQQWQAAISLTEGRLAETIVELRDRLIEALAYLEAQIDFPDEGDTEHLGLDDVLQRLRPVEQRIDHLISTFEAGQISQYGLRVALIGPPNAGKSTLLNTLVGRDRAIVTDIPGTTRDYLEESCIIHGRMIRLIDTAGIRATADTVERLGIDQSLRIAGDADLVVVLHPPSDGFQNDDLEKIASTVRSDRRIDVRTKMDVQGPAAATKMDVEISCHAATGLDVLRRLFSERFDQSVMTISNETFISTLRHRQALQKAQAGIGQFHRAVQTGAYVEMLAFELREATLHLQSIIGNVDVEDILDKVFSEFCLGK